MFSFITLETAFSTTLFSNIGILFSDLWQIVALAIGIPAGFYIVKRLVALVPKK